MKVGLLFGALVGMGLVACWAWGQDDLPKNKLADFMRPKLTHSQKVLEAIVKEDFDGIAKNAEQLKLLSQESDWNVLQTEDYLQNSIEFRRAADALTKAAQNKNMDGAALAYVDLTLKCVSCHKYVRGARIAKAK